MSRGGARPPTRDSANALARDIGRCRLSPGPGLAIVYEGLCGLSSDYCEAKAESQQAGTAWFDNYMTRSSHLPAISRARVGVNQGSISSRP